MLTARAAEPLIEKIQSIQPFGVVIFDQSELVVGASDPAMMGLCRREFKEGCSCALILRGKPVGELMLLGRDEHIRTYLDMARTIAELVLEQEQGDRARPGEQDTAQVFRRLLFGHGDPERLKRDLREARIDLRVPRTAVFFQFDPVSDGPMPEERTLLGVIDRWFLEQKELLISESEPHQVFLLCRNRDHDAVRNRLGLRELCRCMLAEGNARLGIRGKALIGVACTRWEDYEGLYERGTREFDAALGLFPHVDILQEADILLLRLLSELPEETKGRLKGHALGWLPQNRKKEAYLNTIQTFFEQDMSMTETARSLFIHRNTLQHRLKQISRMSGYDMRRADHLLLLRLACLLFLYEG